MLCHMTPFVGVAMLCLCVALYGLVRPYVSLCAAFARLLCIKPWIWVLENHLKKRCKKFAWKHLGQYCKNIGKTLDCSKILMFFILFCEILTDFCVILRFWILWTDLKAYAKYKSYLLPLDATNAHKSKKCLNLQRYFWIFCYTAMI